MTDPQRRALELLAIAPRRTTKVNDENTIGGRTACCLVRMGLAVRDGDLVRITEAGRSA